METFRSLFKACMYNNIEAKRLTALRLPDPAPSDHGAFDGNADERGGVLGARVAAENYEVGQFAGFDGPFGCLFKRCIRPVQGTDTQRLVDGDLLFWTPDGAVHVGA